MKRIVESVFFRLWTFLRGILRLVFYKRTEAWTVERKDGFLILKELFWKHKTGIMGMLTPSNKAMASQTKEVMTIKDGHAFMDASSSFPFTLNIFPKRGVP